MSQTIREYLISHLQTVKERKHQAYKRLVPTVTEVTEAAFALGAILGQIEVGYAVLRRYRMRFSGRRAKYARRGSGRQSRRGKGPRHQETSGREGPHPVRRNRKIPLLFVHENSVRIPIGMLPIENFTWPKPLGKGSLPVSPSAVNQRPLPDCHHFLTVQTGRDKHASRSPGYYVQVRDRRPDMEFLCG